MSDKSLKRKVSPSFSESHLKKHKKTDGTVTNIATLNTRKDIQQLKAQNEKVGKTVLEFEKLQSKVESDIVNNESRLSKALAKVQDLESLVNVTEQRHEKEIKSIKDKFILKNREIIYKTDKQRATLSGFEKELEKINSSFKETNNLLTLERSEHKKLNSKKTILEKSFENIDSKLNQKRMIRKKKQIDLKLTENKLKELTEFMKDKKSLIRQMENALLENEKTRRKYHDRLQELKGNIRVFCRVRPPLESKKEKDLVHVRFFGQDDESLEIVEQSSSSLGRVKDKIHSFTFDRVFAPSSTQKECFEEISQLVQSALDGFNVCIFAYGQTGSGKTYTMQGPSGSNEDTLGMIPRAVQQIYEVAQDLKQFGWEYKMKGQFLEIYNETIHDLLGDPNQYGQIKHEIHHDKIGRTTVSDITTVLFDSPLKVKSMLRKANQNRSTGATQMNERSSRSHSVFTLELTGYNQITKERTMGILNLIDLAGSERLSQSGATGDRMTETININKSLSCLKSVIHALINNKEGGHIPYRNSKLTYLLQNSLGGNCKTLMFVNMSPLIEHLNESICSLRFAAEVNSCHIGTAKKN